MIENYLSLVRDEFKGYNAKSLMADMMAGLTVCAVALPLALAFGVSCGADAAAGLITIIAKDGGELSGVFFVGLLAGILMVIAGIFKLGKLVNLIPKPVITGFTSGIAVIIALGQIDNFFAAIFFPDIATVGEIPKTIFLDKRLNLTAIDWRNLESYIGPAFTIAVLGMIESLLCGASASAMTHGRFDADVELIGQGIGNIIIPFFGGSGRCPYDDCLENERIGFN